MVAISIPIFTSQLEKAREATDIANIRSAYAEASAEALTTEKNKVEKETQNTMQSTGAIDKIVSESVGPWATSSITITKGQKAKVTIDVDADGNATASLSGGATVQ